MPIPTGDLLDTKQAAALLGVHEITLVVWRRERRGPPFVTGKDVRLVLYRKADIEKWLEKNLVRTDGRAQAPAIDRGKARAAK
jgi:Helix-turn-helix domain